MSGHAMPTPELDHRLGSRRSSSGGRAIATYEISIEGRDEWLAAARRLA